jgi:AraC-like DNA-binding protein
MTDRLGVDDGSARPADDPDRVRRRHRPPRAIARALAEASIPPRAMASRRARISIAQFERFHAALTRARDDELFGYFARPVPRGAYATLVHLLTGSADVSAVLDAAAGFYALFDRHRYFHLARERGRAALRLETRDADQARSIFFVHSMLLTPWRTAAWLAGRPIPLDAVVLPPRFRAFRGETRYLFGREPSFAPGAPYLAFRAELARLPVVRRPDEAEVYVRTSLRQILLAPPLPALHAELRALLAATTPVADLAIAAAARRLGRSRATLARELARDGTSFRIVKDEVRRDHAIALLADTSLPLADIAARLGYSEASAFQRAFRAWTGVPPGATRRGARH